LARVRPLEPETFDRRRAADLEKLQLFVLHWRSLELRDNGEAVPLERAGDVRAAAPVGGRRIRGRTAASPVYDDFEFFASAQRRGERRDELARQVPITANNTQTSRRFVRLS